MTRNNQAKKKVKTNANRIRNNRNVNNNSFNNKYKMKNEPKTKLNTKGKHPGGRPLTYSKDIIKKAKEYVDKCEDEEYERIRTEGPASTTYELKLKVNLPTIEGLALHLEVSRETIYDWERKYQEFSDIIDKLRQKQADTLISKGLSGDYNSTIAKVLLTKHGYREGLEQTGKDGKDITLLSEEQINTLKEKLINEAKRDTTTRKD